MKTALALCAALTIGATLPATRWTVVVPQDSGVDAGFYFIGA